MPQYRHGAIQGIVPPEVPHLSARANLAGPAPKRISWLSKCRADLDPLLNDTLGNCVPIVPYRRFQTIDANRTGIVTPIAHQTVLARYQMNGHYVPGDPSTDNGTDTTVDALNEIAAPILGPDGAPRPVWWGQVTPGDVNHVAMALAQAPLSITLGLPVALEDAPEEWANPPRSGAGWNPAGGPRHRVLLGDLEDGFWTVVTWGRHVRIHPDLLRLPGFVIAVDVFLEARALQDLTLAGVDYERMHADIAILAA